MKKHLLILSVLFLFFQAAKAQTAVSVLQYYNTTTHKHFYTTSGTEITVGQGGWTQQSDLGRLYNSNQTLVGPAVYRFYQGSSYAHYYSNNRNVFPDGFVYEGVMGYETTTPLASYGTRKAVYEFFNTSTGDYYYSTSSAAVTGYHLNGATFHVF
ncbi:hypothetical protein KXD93_09665 [Mucilaginibacter sp. BJC16-A38]|uniref:hypothetical protein n=1 Tax=Mucilaginibacter phenanthrenivorans TaxID=1234842 RepID=UPI002157B158|nr:hypothetical protein [Mucilaginibacter phenanthrenivorans]MCR8557909.1 hypothetical protein [Mucilaginibacter phenanthrenivorans]